MSTINNRESRKKFKSVHLNQGYQIHLSHNLILLQYQVSKVVYMKGIKDGKKRRREEFSLKEKECLNLK